MIIAETHRHLLETALWIVFDPWRRQRSQNQADSEQLQRADVINNYFCEQIFLSLTTDPVPNHTAISCPNPDILLHGGVHHLFQDWRNCNTPELITEYMTINSLRNIVYLGFHHGLCVIHRPTGAEHMRHRYSCYLKRDLTVCLSTTTSTHRNIQAIKHWDRVSEAVFDHII